MLDRVVSWILTVVVAAVMVLAIGVIAAHAGSKLILVDEIGRWYLGDKVARQGDVVTVATVVEAPTGEKMAGIAKIDCGARTVKIEKTFAVIGTDVVELPMSDEERAWSPIEEGAPAEAAAEHVCGEEV